MFLSRSTEREAGHDGKTVVIDTQDVVIDFKKKAELTNIFWAYFFSCIYFREI